MIMRATHKKLMLFFGLTIPFCLLITGTAVAADFVLMLKSGVMQLADETQTLDGTSHTFSDKSDRTLALGWEIRTDKNVGLGMEYITYEHDFDASPAAYTRSQIYLFSARKYFVPSKVFHPFAGIGLGWGFTRYNDGIQHTDEDWNLALQLTGGFELQFSEGFAVFLEAKGLASGTDGERANEFDFSSTGLMAGVSFIF
jgi:opacity protein-like surface antigen